MIIHHTDGKIKKMMTKNELVNKYLSVTTLSESLAERCRPVALYGTGNGADKVISMILGPLGVSPEAVFASDGFVRSRTYAGLPVESLAGVSSRLGDDVDVLMCFGSDREEVISFAESLDGRFSFAIPDVPLYGNGLFDRAYATEHSDELYEARSLLSDEESKELFDDSVLYRLTGKMKYLRRTERVEDSYRSIFAGRDIVAAVDGGAYRGETSRMWREVFPALEKIYAVEPDARTAAKFEPPAGCEVGLVNAALTDFCGEETFHSSSSRGAGIAGKNRRGRDETVRCVTLDSVVTGRVDLIKLDVEGFEERALRGAKRLMTEYAPSLAVSLYHRTDDIWKLPLMINNFSRDYAEMKFFLRRPRCLPCWDLTLFCVKEV